LAAAMIGWLALGCFGAVVAVICYLCVRPTCPVPPPTLFLDAGANPVDPQEHIE
jgi:hypothetical protein